MLRLTSSLLFITFVTSFVSGQLFGAPSCAGRCGRQPSLIHRLSLECSCAASCEMQRNCCRDYRTFCSKSCKERCGNEYHALFACQCYDKCEGESCCADYTDLCDGASARSLSTTLPLPPTTRRTTTVKLRPIEIGYSFVQGKEITCPKGIAFVVCPSNPCNVPCDMYPGAVCSINQCDTCEAVYTDGMGVQLDCRDPSKHCTNGERRFECGDTDLCAGTSCPAFPRAVCVPNKCGGCFYDFVDDKGQIVDCELAQPMKPQCSEGKKPFVCFPPPCHGQVCFADISAQCKNIVCGECRAEFYDARGNVVDCNARGPKQADCDEECAVDPCQSARCQAYPKAQCVSKKTTACGKCEVSFSLNGVNVDCSKPKIAPVCPNGKLRSKCHSRLCLGQKCGNDLALICKPDECNDCDIKFYDARDNEITCDESSSRSLVINKCDNGDERMACDGSLCANAKCVGIPMALCREDPCDSCNPRFYDISLRELNCKVEDETTTIVSSPIGTGSPRCPNGNVLRNCDHDLTCESAVCDTNLSSICKANPCDGCKPIFFGEDGIKITCNPITISSSCAGSCGEGRDERNSCHCDSGCRNRKDCCDDFVERCETCLGRCGKNITNATCQCTSDCRLYNNCCADFKDVCLPEISCKGKCGSSGDQEDICYCHEGCEEKSNCCLDYHSECN